MIKVTFLTLSVIHRELEKQRTITSMPLAEERQILKEINYTKKQKLQLDEYNAIDKEIQEKRGYVVVVFWSSKLSCVWFKWQLMTTTL